MRRLLLSTLAILACAAPAPSRQSTAKELRGLKGPVKTVRTKWRTAPWGRVETPDTARTFDVEITFDREGRKMEESRYDPVGKIESRKVYTYEADVTTIVSYNPDGTVLSRAVWKEEFDRVRGTLRQTVTEERVTTGDAFSYERFNQYDARGRMIESLYYRGGGTLRARTTVRFGADGVLEEAVTYDGAGVVCSRNERSPEGTRAFVRGRGGALVLTEVWWRPVCKESDSYGNCQRETNKKTVIKAGKAEEVVDVVSRTFTYY